MNSRTERMIIKTHLTNIRFYYLCIVCVGFLFPQNPNIRFDRIGAEHGLSNVNFASLHQDNYGFIWIGTSNGLNLYDGYSIKVYRTEPGNSNSLIGDQVNNIYETKDSVLWISTGNGLSRYNRGSEDFTNYQADPGTLSSVRNIYDEVIEDGQWLWIASVEEIMRFDSETGQFTFYDEISISSTSINNRHIMCRDKSGILWIGSWQDDHCQLSKYDVENDSFIHFVPEGEGSSGNIGSPILSIISDKNDDIWMATAFDGLLKLNDKERGGFQSYRHDDDNPRSIIHNELSFVYEDKKGNIWSGGREGLSRLNDKSNNFTSFKVSGSKIFNRSTHINGITEKSDGSFWLKSHNGVFRLNPETGDMIHYNYDPDDATSLCDYHITHIMVDDRDQLWFASIDNAVCTINEYSNSFQQVKRDPGNPKSLSHNNVSRFLVDCRGYLWVGTYQYGGLNKTKINDDHVIAEFQHYFNDPEDAHSLSNNKISALYEDQYENLWVGTRSGLCKYNPHTDNFTRYLHDPQDPTSINNDAVETIHEDSAGKLWIGTREGLNFLNRDTGRFNRLEDELNAKYQMSIGDVRNIHEDGNKNLWVSSRNLSKFTLADTTIQTYYVDSGVPGSLSGYGPRIVVDDNVGNLWVGTASGLNLMDRETGTFTAYLESDGLASNAITGICLDNKSNLWMSTTNGISQFDPANQTFKNYNVEDGLVGVMFEDRSYYKDQDGWMYFGGFNGFNVFHPDSIKDNTVIPPVYLTSFYLFEDRVYFDLPLYEMDHIDLNYDENDFTLGYITLNYVNSKKNQYAFKLDGYDDDWIHCGDQRSVRYTNIDPGDYTFRVKGCNNDGYWNEDGDWLTITISPPWWQTGTAYAGYMVIFLILIAGAWRIALNRARTIDKLKMIQFEAEKLQEVDHLKSTFFANISHEFRTPLTLILGPLDQLLKSNFTDEIRHQFRVMQRNGQRLLGLINQLLDLSKLESGEMKLQAGPMEIVKLSRTLFESFSSQADLRRITAEFKSKPDHLQVYIDQDKYEKILTNLLSNAFKFTPVGGIITLTIERDKSNIVIISISDSGPGIPPDKIARIFQRFYQVDDSFTKEQGGTGIGLALTKELVETHHGTIVATSRSGYGATFTVSLPIGMDHLQHEEIIDVNEESGSKLIQDGTAASDLYYEPASTTDKKIPNSRHQSDPILLLVEDNSDVRDYIRGFLDQNYRIIEAVDGKEGLQTAVNKIPDLIISDVMMPHMDGVEMCRRIKTDQRTCHIPIILLTAKASIEHKLEGLETGADAYITKPFDAAELQVRVRNLVEQRRILREKFRKDGTFQPANQHISSMDERLMERVMDIAERHIPDEDFTVERFALETSMSRKHLHRKLLALTGLGPSEFIRFIRLQKAKQLLEQHYDNITQIAYEVGFSNPSYFSQCFRKQFGVSPSQYAIKLSKNVNPH